MVGRWIKQVFGLQTPKGFKRGLSDVPKVASTTKKVRRRKKKANEDAVEAHTLAHAPPKLTFPFTSTNNELETTTSTITKTSKSKQPNPPDSFLTKEDSMEGRYYLFKSYDQEQYRLPSVTTVLQSTMSNSSWFGLHQWRKGMIEEHGEKGYKRIRSEIIQSGVLFHQLLEERLKSRTHPTKPSQQTGSGSHGNTIQSNGSLNNSDKGSTTSDSTSGSPAIHGVYYDSVKNILADISDVMVTEGVVRHERLGYSGTVDCVARYKGELCVIDWKTSNKPRPLLKDLHDYPLQVMAYAGALNSDIKYDFKVHNALIVVAYSTGSEGDAHWLDTELCLQYWDAWLDRLNQFQTQFAHDLTDIYL